MISRFALLFPFAAVLALAGCADPLSRACPEAGIVADLERWTEARPGAAADDPQAVVATARIVSVTGDCTYNDEEARVTVDAVFEAVKGPAALGEAAELRYAVTIVDPVGAIVGKRVFDLVIPYVDQGGRRGMTTESLVQTIPIGGPFSSAAGYRILLGFQLKPEQLQRNRAAAAR